MTMLVVDINYEF